MKKVIIFINLTICTSISLISNAQVSALMIEKMVTDEDHLNTLGVHYPALMQAFYKSNGFQPVWITAVNTWNRQVLFHDISEAGNLGLNAGDYHYPTLQGVQGNSRLKSDVDSAITELLLTDAAIHFYGDVQNGNTAPAFNYDGLKYQPDRAHMIEALIAYVKKGRLDHFIADIEPALEAYFNIKQQVVHLNTIIKRKDFKEVIITSNRTDTSNSELVGKLYQLGLLDTPSFKTSAAVLVQKLKEAQKLFSLMSDGVLRSLTLEALNVPLQRRANELQTALNYVRWANAIQRQNPVILVNIPSASLLVYDHGRLILDSRIIVGKPATPTPTLSSTITEIILYPYWMVPHNIATKELLPRIKRNRAYLEQNNYQVLNKQGIIVNPKNIDWDSLSAKNFPYIIRQSTGCDNSLGIVKLNFYNPYTVYLHDTPGKTLFSLNKRYFSHGCMRVEKALELAFLAANDHRNEMDAIIRKGCLKNQAPVVIPASQPMDVFVVYSTVWYDKAGTVTFYDDIYHKLNTAGNLKQQLFQTPIVAKHIE